MRKAFVEPVLLPEPRFRDGLGVRYVRADGSHGQVEVLRPLWDVGSIQSAIRQRVSRLASFRQARFVPVRAAEVPKDAPSMIEVVSDYVAGHRLSQFLEASHAGAVSIETHTAIYIVRELLGALALLHESRGVTHGAAGPERILITPKGRVVVADYVLGPAIERLEFTRSRLWREFRIAVPPGTGQPRLDASADVMQVGMTALALLARRPVALSEYPDRIDELVSSVGRRSGADGRPVVPAPLIGWLRRALLKDQSAGFATVSDARTGLEAALSKAPAGTGGAAALKSLAEEFDRHLAALDRRASAAAPATDRDTAAAQPASERAARTTPETDAAPVSSDSASAPAFAVLPDPVSLLVSDSIVPSPDLDAAPGDASEAEPSVGWRVPEPPPIEETLPTSPLLQVGAPPIETPAGEFVEEVLDLGGLTGLEETDLAEACEGIPCEPASAPAETAEEVPPVAALVAADGEADGCADLRDLNAAEPGAESALLVSMTAEAGPPSPGVVIGEPIEPTPVEHAERPMADIPTPSVPDAGAALEPEWWALADPARAAAPTIDAELPTETLEELAAEFAAVGAQEAPPDVVADGLMESAAVPIATADVPTRITDARSPAADAQTEAADAPAVTASAPLVPAGGAADAAVPGATEAADTQAPAEAVLPVLGVILTLQDAQAAAQAAVASGDQSHDLEETVGAGFERIAEDAPAVRAPVPTEVRERTFIDDLREALALAGEPPAGDLEPSPVAAMAAESSVEPHAGQPPLDTVRAILGSSRDERFPPESEAVPEPSAVSAEATDVAAAGTPAQTEAEPISAVPDGWVIGAGGDRVAQEPSPLDPALPAPVSPAGLSQSERLPDEIGERVPARGSEVRPAARRHRTPVFEDRHIVPLPPPAVRDAPPEPVDSGPSPLARIRTATAGGVEAIGCFAVSAGRGVARGVRAAARGVVAGSVALLRGVGAAVRAVGIGVTTLLSRTAATAAAAMASGARFVASGARLVASGAKSVAAAAWRAGAGLLGLLGLTLGAAGRAATYGLAGAAKGFRAIGTTAAAVVKAASTTLLALGVAGTRGTARLLRACGQGISAVARGAAAAVAAASKGGVRGLRAGAAAAGWTTRWIVGASARLGRGSARAASRAASGTASVGSLAGRGTVRAARGVFTAAAAAVRSSYFAATDVADRLPKPAIRPWHLGAALLVIVAAAGVPWARSQWFAAKPAAGTLRVESSRPGLFVTIDGVPGGQAPLSATLGIGRHRIEVSGAGRTRVHDVEVKAGRETVLQAGWTELRETGAIRLVSDPAGAEIWLDGVMHGTSPLTMENVAEGAHSILVRHPSGSVRQKVVVRPNETVEANVQVRPGWLAVFAPVRLDVLKDGHSIGSTEGGRILAPPGEYTIELVGESVGYRESLRVEVKPGEVLAFTAKLPLGSLEIAAPADTEVSIDGDVIGRTPLEPVPVTVGTREVVMRHPTFGERRQVVTVVCGAGSRVAFQ